MKEILPGIYQIVLKLEGFSPSSVNAYLIQDQDSCTLIDTGWDLPASVSSLETQIGEAGFRFADVNRVILTHLHSDHLGMMGRFQERNQALTYLHQADQALVHLRYAEDNSYWRLTEKFLQDHGASESGLKPPAFEMPVPGKQPSPDILLQGDEEIPVGRYNFKVIHTPGHTPGHISLYEPHQKFLISGDVLLPTIATNAATHVQYMVNPIQQYLNSLSTLHQLEIDLVLPGHEYVFRNHRQRIAELVEHYRQKSQGILEDFQADNQPKTAFDVASRRHYILKSRSVHWDQLGGWDQRFALMQTIALLEELASAQKLTRFSHDGKIYYR